MPHVPTAADKLSDKRQALEAESAETKGNPGLLARIAVAQLAALIEILRRLEARG